MEELPTGITNHLTPNKMTSFNSNSPANGFVVDSVDDFYLRGGGSDFEGYGGQYMSPYPRYHQPYPAHRFDVPLTPPQPDRTSPCDLAFFNGTTPRYGHATHVYESNLYNNHQNYYQHANAMPPYRAEATPTVETIEFDSCKMISPAFTPPGSSHYQAPVVPSQSADSSPSDSGVSTSPPVGQKTVPNSPDSVYPWMKANASKCFVSSLQTNLLRICKYARIVLIFGRYKGTQPCLASRAFIISLRKVSCLNRNYFLYI